MTVSNERCEFESEDAADLMTEEEWEAQQMEEKSRMNRDDREMKGYQRK